MELTEVCTMLDRQEEARRRPPRRRPVYSFLPHLTSTIQAAAPLLTPQRRTNMKLKTTALLQTIAQGECSRMKSASRQKAAV
jgi:hypothetical protein